MTDGVKTSTIVANVNGVANQTLTAKDTNTAKIHELAQNVGTLYQVSLTADGYVNTVTPVRTINGTIAAIPGYKFGYLGTSSGLGANVDELRHVVVGADIVGVDSPHALTGKSNGIQLDVGLVADDGLSCSPWPMRSLPRRISPA